MNSHNKIPLSGGRWPSKKQWLQFFRVLEKKEKIAFGILFALFASSLVFLVSGFYLSHTVKVPADYGRIREGVLGQPQFVNPLYSPSSDVDRDISELVFSSLMTYDDNGNIVPDLISGYNMEDGGKTMEFSIKENAKWHDGTPLTIDDVIFTVDLVQDADYLSPLRTNWQGVEIEKVSDYKAIFKLKQAYSGFAETLVNLKIMPKHIWEGVSVQAMTSNTQLNVIAPVGSGPYMVKKTVLKGDKTVKSMILSANSDYYGTKPHISRIDFYFFDKREDLVNNLKKGNLDAGSIEAGSYDEKSFKKYTLNSISTPDYFAIFLNNLDKPFDSKEMRQAFAYITDRQEIEEKVLNGQGEVIDSPLLPSFYGLAEPEQPLQYDEAKGLQILDKNGYVLEDGLRKKTIEKSSGFKFSKTLQSGSSGTEVSKLQECLAQDKEIYPAGTISGSFGQQTKDAVIKFQEKYKDEILTPNGLTEGTGKVAGATIKKLNEVCFSVPAEEIPLSFTLKTTSHPILQKAAQMIKEQWEKQGISIEIQTLSETEIKKVIRERDFEILLFGEQMGGIPEPTPFWHSSQRIDPGLNLSSYNNSKADGLMEKARKYSDYMSADRLKALSDLQDLLVSDAPAVPLFTADYLYLTKSDIKGINLQKITDASKRFVNVENWYIKEKRVWKQN